MGVEYEDKPNIVQIDKSGNNVEIAYGGPQGAQGLSAYQVAQSEGFTGTEEQWLESLVGPGLPENSLAGEIAVYNGSEWQSRNLSELVSYTHNQIAASSLWTIVHNLNFYPQLTVFDSGGSMVEGEVTHTSTEALTISFSSQISGTAQLS
jgi:hypothetical protein